MSWSGSCAEVVIFVKINTKPRWRMWYEHLNGDAC